MLTVSALFEQLDHRAHADDINKCRRKIGAKRNCGSLENTACLEWIDPLYLVDCLSSSRAYYWFDFSHFQKIKSRVFNFLNFYVDNKFKIKTNKQKYDYHASQKSFSGPYLLTSRLMMLKILTTKVFVLAAFPKVRLLKLGNDVLNFGVTLSFPQNMSWSTFVYRVWCCQFSM